MQIWLRSKHICMYKQIQIKIFLNEACQHTAFIAETGSHPPCCCCARSSRGITADCL